MRDQAEKLRQMMYGISNQPKSAVIKQQSETKARVITVTSGKGGVGKTNFTVNMALALSAMGQKVMIIDADLGMANVDVILGASPPYSILHLLQDGVSVNDVIAEGPQGIKFISGGSGMYHLANLNSAQLQRLVSQITLCDSLVDIILLDTGAGLNRNVLSFVMAADEVIIITTPEPTAITDAYAMMKAYSSHDGQGVLKLVVNRVVEIDEGQMVVDKLLKVSQRFLGVPITSLGFIYEDRNLIKAVKNQAPVLIQFPNTISSRCIENIAQRLLYGENIPRSKGIKGFFNKFLEIKW